MKDASPHGYGSTHRTELTDQERAARILVAQLEDLVKRLRAAQQTLEQDSASHDQGM